VQISTDRQSSNHKTGEKIMLVALLIVILTSVFAAIIRVAIGAGKSKQSITPLNQVGFVQQYQMSPNSNNLPMYISKNNQQLGPYPPEQVLTMLNNGILTPFDMAIKQGEQQ
jgi:hypothetical protein